jgi:hypothetical protein
VTYLNSVPVKLNFTVILSAGAYSLKALGSTWNAAVHSTYPNGVPRETDSTVVLRKPSQI